MKTFTDIVTEVTEHIERKYELQEPNLIDEETFKVTFIKDGFSIEFYVTDLGDEIYSKDAVYKDTELITVDEEVPESVHQAIAELTALVKEE